MIQNGLKKLKTKREQLKKDFGSIILKRTLGYLVMALAISS
jgi:hypothetical protein